MSYTLALEHVDPFGKPDLGPCYACGEAITWEDRRLVRVSVRESEVLLLHEPCFEHYLAGLRLFDFLVVQPGGMKPLH